MFKKIFKILFLSTLVCACSSSDEAFEDLVIFEDDFDRGLMLTNLVDNIIIPSYENFSEKMTLMNQEGNHFVSSPNQNTLDAFRTSWYNAYIAWQGVEMFNIGKAEELQYAFYMNVYPLTVADVENNITNGGYELNSVNNHDAQGFPALDYLLHGIAANDAELLDIFTTGSDALAYRNYALDVLNQMDTLTKLILNDWKGTFRATFINSKANTATSSLNKLVNDFIYYYEKGLRANKIGIPAGVFSSSPLPEKVEAYFREDISRELALEALQSVEDFFNGKYFNGNETGHSFKSYLQYLNREDLGVSILDQFTMARSKISDLNENLVEQINTDNSKMTVAYDELQKALVLLKVDMLQAFSINVDYVDADGD